ncbi:MAG TPA: hypothetical protein VN893_24225 [Bryobacteraceae bacterium]|nr:hypothetical protein [Bryobacteraceae bacterium]
MKHKKDWDGLADDPKQLNPNDPGVLEEMFEGLKVMGVKPEFLVEHRKEYEEWLKKREQQSDDPEDR